MSKSYRRYEILLPLKFNDGQPIPDELIGTTLRELRSQFGSISAESQTSHGTWSNLGQEYRDDLVRVFVDVQDKATARKFFKQFKEDAKATVQSIGYLDYDLSRRCHLNSDDVLSAQDDLTLMLCHHMTGEA